MSAVPARLGPWWQRPYVAFDLETTCVDPETARIVGAAVMTVNCPADLRCSQEWVVNPGVPIDPGAAAVHGYTDDYVREHGMDPAEVVPVIDHQLQAAWRQGWPVVIYNASFDLTVLDRELRRRGWAGVELSGLVVDPFILDVIQVPRRRSGERRLHAVARAWGADKLDPTALHGATRDALAAARIAYMIGRRTGLGELTDGVLMAVQTVTAVAWRRDLRQWFERKGKLDDAARVREEWPVWSYRGATTRELEAGQ